ncbi:MAG: MCE family protein [Clostridium sp.]|nr:MCE family protein [Clostridium sp.]
MKKHLLWIGELFIWGLLIFSTLFVSLYVYNSNVRKKHTYYVFFKDIDGLIKGSPVKMLGYQVGYVSDISIVNEDVFITFIITDKKLKMPERMSATVEFTGMGGSKSLELSVPDEKTNPKNYITAVEPRRLQDFYVYTNQMANLILGMTSDFMKIMDARRTDLLKNFIKNPSVLHDVHRTLDDVQKSESQFMERRKNYER